VKEKLLASLRRKKTTIGLDIGSGLIKVAVVDHGKSAPELVRVAITPLSSDAIVEGEVMDSGIVADAIRDAMSQVGVQSSHVITAVGGRDVIIKRIQTERVKEQQARELMRWEAEQHVPDVESVEMDFQVLDPENNTDEMSVLLVAAKKELVEARIRLLNEAGLTRGRGRVCPA
jgi:type IV pilus assembly protein PilM